MTLLQKVNSRKIVGEVYRVCDMPVNYVLGFRKKPEGDDNTYWMTTCMHIRSKQYVLVVEELGMEDLGNEYYKVIADEGTFWVHGYDLVRVDHVTGEITGSVKSSS